MAFSRSAFAESLQGCISIPSSSRAKAYNDIFLSTLRLPRSTLSSDDLLQICSHYLDVTVFSELNSSGGGLVVGRSTLTSFDESIRRIVGASDDMQHDAQGEDESTQPAIRDEEAQRDVLEAALAKVQPRVLSFEEQATLLRLHLADVYEALHDWSDAAMVLQGIPLDSGHRAVSDLTKLRIYVRISRLLLEADDAISADAYLKRASMVIHPALSGSAGEATAASGGEGRNHEASSSSSTAEENTAQEAKLLSLQYKLCQAKIYDAQRRFAEAAVRFHELSYVADIDQEERIMMLGAAVTASILAPAGPHRSRILSTLMRDERVSSLPQATILSKVFLDHIVRPSEVAAFEEMLQPHQKAQLARTGNEKEMIRLEAEAEARTDGVDPPMTASTSTTVKSTPSTVLDRAMMEHNILASSKLYMNITFTGLGSLLNLTPAGAETIVRRMIAQKRLKAEIDQVDGVLTVLESASEAPTAGGLGVGTSTDAALGANEGGGSSSALGSDEHDAVAVGEGDGLTRRWDAQIAKTASSLEDVCVRIASLSQTSAAQEVPPVAG